MQGLFDPLVTSLCSAPCGQESPGIFRKYLNTNIAIFSSNKARIQLPLLFLDDTQSMFEIS